jgi:hypothetical protein
MPAKQELALQTDNKKAPAEIAQSELYLLFKLKN